MNTARNQVEAAARNQAEAAARVAALVRALPDTALCVLVDAMQWVIAEGHDAEIVQTIEDSAAIRIMLDEATSVC